MEVIKLLIMLTTSHQMCMGYKVLLLAPVGSRSLYNLNLALGENLVQAGHDVTLVSPFNASNSNGKIHEIHTGATKEEMSQNIFAVRGATNIFNMFREISIRRGEQMWTNQNILSLWERRNDFDAIVAIAYMNEIISPFLMDYKGVYIGFCTPGVEAFQVSNNGHWLPMSVVPMLFLPYDEHMSFMERAINPVVSLLAWQLYLYIQVPGAQITVEKFFPQTPPVLDLYNNYSLLLINGHFALDGPVPLHPNQIEIGTINAKKTKPLPKDLEEFMSGSPEGVIYFSLGSIAKSSDIPQKYKEMFVAAFKAVPQRVVWKYEGQDLDLPPNVLTQKWLPQQDILGHPSTRIFITHCGNLGTQEAKYHGVPMLAVPISFDQPRNAARLARKGFAVMINWEDMTVTNIVDAINTLIHDPMYHERLQKVSAALQDQKESPGERAVWWVEYAIRHKDSGHLKYAGKRLSFLQYHLLDVLAFWLALLTGLCLGLCYCCRSCARGIWLEESMARGAQVRSKQD